MLNVSRLIHLYASGGKADFIEGESFRTIVYINENDANKETGDTVSDTVSDTVKQRLIKIVKLVIQHPGMRSTYLAKEISIGESSLRRDMQRINKLVEFIGAPRTGGYYITSYMKDKLKES